jgi:hypothetical protein
MQDRRRENYPMIRTYSDLLHFQTFEDRFQYLKLRGIVGDATFGLDRYINQGFYTSTQWKRIRDLVLIRDEGCDLGVSGYEIHYRPVIHHLNPMTVDDIRHGDDSILDPEFLITTTHRTHNAIHYGDESLLIKLYKPRQPGDTKLW